LNFFPLGQLGAREDPLQPGVVDFGVLLPGITPADGTLSVKIIHQHDQFLQDIQPVEQPLTHGQLDGLGDYWSGTVDINGIPKLVEGASSERMISHSCAVSVAPPLSFANSAGDASHLRI